MKVSKRCLKTNLAFAFVLIFAGPAFSQEEELSNVIADPAQVGGESDGEIHVAHVVYARDKSSECFSDHFLMRASKDASINTSRRLHSVKLSTDDVYSFPLLIMTGEGAFSLTESERTTLRAFVDRGGLVLASAGCSSTEWNSSFRKEMAKIFADQPMEPLTMDHLIFHTVYDIENLKAKKGTPKPLEGIHIGNRLGVLYSQDGLNDTKNKNGCCCCGGNEITNSEMVNVNILVYSLLH